MNKEIKFRVYDKDFKRMRYLNSSHDIIHKIVEDYFKIGS